MAYILLSLEFLGGLLLKDQPDDNHKKNHMALTFQSWLPPALSHHPTQGVSMELTERMPKMGIFKLTSLLTWILIFCMTLDEWPHPICFVFSSEEDEFSWLTPEVFLAPECRDTRSGLTCLLAIVLPGTWPWDFHRVGSAPGPDTSSLHAPELVAAFLWCPLSLSIKQRQWFLLIRGHQMR